MRVILFGATGMIGQGVLRVAPEGAPKLLLKNADLNALAQA